MCSHQKSCEIGCAYLVKPEDIFKFKENIDREITKNEERSERLSVLFAEGKIGEQSYAKSATLLEEKINALKEAKETPLVSPNYFHRLREPESSLTEKPRVSIPSRAETIAVLMVGGFMTIFFGYLLTQGAYQYVTPSLTYFYPVRYYGGIFGIIIGVVSVILGIILLLTRGRRAHMSNEVFK